MPKLRVSNISKLVNSGHLSDLFKSFGELNSVSDCKDEGDAQSCIIDFKNAADAETAKSLSGTNLGDREFIVEDYNEEASKSANGGKADEKDLKKDQANEKGKERRKDKDDDSDSDSDRRSRKRRRDRDRDRGRRRRDDSRDRDRGRRRRDRSRSRSRRRRKKKGRRRRRRDSDSDDSEEEQRRKRNVNPQPTRFWDGFQWHDISAGQPQGLENRPLASQVNMSQLLMAQKEAMAAGAVVGTVGAVAGPAPAPGVAGPAPAPGTQ